MRYCTGCGASLTSGDAHHHRRYAAAPSEAAVAVRFVSTLLPRLPKAHMLIFNVSLVLGLAVVMVLAILGFYPLALAAGAFIVPLLMVVYIYDVDDYEDEPWRVTLFTVAWGVVAGVAFGFLLRAALPASTTNLLTESSGSTILRDVVLPLVGGALALVGPLVLLPYRKFNDVLDGATFGVTAGVTFAGAQIIVESLDLLGSGLHPGGDAVSWILRILVHSILAPVVFGGAVGVTTGAFWLHYRAPVRDRDKLGPIGRPIVALIAAGVLLVASGVVLAELRDWVRLIVEAALAAIALVWLRLVIHLGLLEEISEAAEGPEVVCANCGMSTPRGSFCGACGISMRALPKRPAGTAPSTPPVAPTPAAPSSPSGAPSA